MKKLMTVALGAILALTMVGCSKKAKADKMNISVFTIQQRQQPPADNKTYKWIEEKFGVTFSWDILVGDKDQKIGVLIASGDLPDLVEVDSEKFQGAGCLIDIKPLVEQYCPNIMKHYSNVWKEMVYTDSEKDANGNITKEHLYSLPNWGVLDGPDAGTFYNQNAWWIQKTVLKEFGFPTIKTVDQYFDLLEAYAKKYPTIDGAKTIPFSIITADWEAFNLWNPPTFLAGNPNDGNGHVVANADGTYTYVDNFADENAKKWFKLANGYYQRGLIDPASFTDNRDQYYAKIAQGRVLGMFIQGWQFQGDTENTLITAGKYDRTYAPLPIVFDESIKPYYVDESLPNLQRGYGFTVKCGEKKAIEILKFLDTLLEDENQKIIQWGFEGQDWQKDAQGRPSRTQAQRDEQSDPNWVLKNKATLLYEEAPKKEGTYADGLACQMNDLPWEYAAIVADPKKAIDQEIWDAYGVASYKGLARGGYETPHNPGWYPMYQCNPSPENDGFEHEAAVAMTGFETIQRKYLPMMIMGKPEDFEKTWAEYEKLMKPLTETYNKFMQTQLDARVKNFGGLK